MIWFKWQLQRLWSQLTIYKLILAALILWLLGMWLWALPVYQLGVKQLGSENIRLESFIAEHSSVKLIIVSNNELIPSSDDIQPNRVESSLSYDGLLALAAQQHLLFSEYREIKSNKKLQYQLTVKGSWLNIRELLAVLISDKVSNIQIHSLDLQRDRTTNEVSLTLILAKQTGRQP